MASINFVDIDIDRGQWLLIHVIAYHQVVEIPPLINEDFHFCYKASLGFSRVE